MTAALCSWSLPLAAQDKPIGNAKYQDVSNITPQSGVAPASTARPSQPYAGGIANAGADGDIEQLVTIVMMESARSANKDLRRILEELRRLNRQKQEVRDAMAAMARAQSRFRNDPGLKPDQRKWADTLSIRCPPGSSDDCLLRELRIRTQALNEHNWRSRP